MATINEKEAAMILAGLRLLQVELVNCRGMPLDVERILDDVGGETEIDLKEIDALCEKVNFDDSEACLDALAGCYNGLSAWVEIADKEDKRESDDEAIAAVAEVLRTHGRLK